MDFEVRRFPFAPGDRLFIHTDGVANASRLDVGTFGEKRLHVEGLAALLERHKGHDLENMVAFTWKDILVFCNEKPKDDMLLFGIGIPEKR